MEEKKENRQLNPEGAVDRSAWVLCEQQEGLWAGLGGQVFFRMEGKKNVWKKECPVQGEELPSRSCSVLEHRTPAAASWISRSREGISSAVFASLSPLPQQAECYHCGSKIPRAKEAQLCGLGSCGGVQGLRHWCGISPWNHCETTDMTVFKDTTQNIFAF